MKYFRYFIVLIIALFMVNVTAYACSTSDGCTGCYPEAAATACRNSLNSQTQQIKDKCNSGNDIADAECKKGITNANRNGTGTSTSNNNNSNNNNGGGNGGGSTTTTTPDNAAICAECSSYNNNDDATPTEETKNKCQAAGCPIQEPEKKQGVIKGSGTQYKDVDTSKNANITGCENVFGNYSNGKFTDKNSLGYFLQMAFNIIKYVVPIILIVLTLVDFLKAIASSDKEIVKTATAKLTKRAIIALAIFLIPTILNLILGLVTTYGTCGVK